MKFDFGNLLGWIISWEGEGESVGGRKNDVLGVEFLENGVNGFCKILFLDDGDDCVDIFVIEKDK